LKTEEENGISLFYIIDKIKKKIQLLSVKYDEEQKNPCLIPSEKVFNKLKYVNGANHPIISEIQEIQPSPSTLIDTAGFREEVLKMIKHILKQPEMCDDVNYQYPVQRNSIKESICNLIGFIEAKISPGFIDEL
jgi:hypothetical protein